MGKRFAALGTPSAPVFNLNAFPFCQLLAHLNYLFLSLLRYATADVSDVPHEAVWTLVNIEGWIVVAVGSVHSANGNRLSGMSDLALALPVSTINDSFHDYLPRPRTAAAISERS